MMRKKEKSLRLLIKPHAPENTEKCLKSAENAENAENAGWTAALLKLHKPARRACTTPRSTPLQATAPPANWQTLELY